MSMITIVLTSLVASFSGGNCSFALYRAVERPDTATSFLVRAVADSVFMGVYYRGPHSLTQQKPDTFASGRSVYGQLFYVAKGHQAGPHAPQTGQRLILIWWSYNPACGRDYPWNTLRVPAGSEVFVSLAPRPPDGWVNGIPVIDVDGWNTGTHAVYSPLFEARVVYYNGQIPHAIDPVDAADYATMFENLPRESDLRRDNRAALMRFLKWAERNRRISTRDPIAEMVESTRVNAGVARPQ